MVRPGKQSHSYDSRVLFGSWRSQGQEEPCLFTEGPTAHDPDARVESPSLLALELISVGYVWQQGQHASARLHGKKQKRKEEWLKKERMHLSQRCSGNVTYKNLPACNKKQQYF